MLSFQKDSCLCFNHNADQQARVKFYYLKKEFEKLSSGMYSITSLKLKFTFANLPLNTLKEIYKGILLDAFIRRINDGLDRYCGRRYSDSKSKLHKHFKDHGGKHDVDRARRNPPSRFISRPTIWNKTIDDVFLNPKWQDRSKKNSNSRKKQLFPSFHGTRTYVNEHFKRMNPGT